MRKNYWLRGIIFAGVLILSFFVPWQLTALLVILASLAVPYPLEYAIITIGVFGIGLLFYLFLTTALLGGFVRSRTRIGSLLPL